MLSHDSLCPNTCRCALHPLKKRACVRDNQALKYCSAAAALLTYAKLADDITDSKGVKKLFSKCLRPFAGHWLKKAAKAENLPSEQVFSSLEELSRLENQNEPSVDTPADVFGDLLAAVFACGLDEKEARIAAVIGRSAGRYIYVVDAADDREKDKKSGNYNPLNTCPVENKDLSTAVRLELEKMEAAVNLMDFTGKPELEGIIKNIVYEGLPKNADAIFGRKEK